jgi:hypothetical protein
MADDINDLTYDTLVRQGPKTSARRVVVSDSLGSDISPATTGKQDEIITAIENITIPPPEGGATSDNQTNGSQKTQLVDSSGNNMDDTAGNYYFRPVNNSLNAVNPSTSDNQTNGTQKTQIVDAAGNPAMIGGILQTAVTDSGGNPMEVALASAQTDGSQKTQIVDPLGNTVVPTTPTDIQLSELIPLFRALLIAIANPSYVDKSANVIRNQVQSGTVTTVTTVTNLTNFGTQGADVTYRINSLTSWGINVRSLIT